MTTTLNIYEIRCTIFIKSHALYMISHLLCMMSHSLCVLHHTMALSMTWNTMVMTYSLDMASRTVLWPHIHCVPSQPLCMTLHSVYFWHDTQCTNFMKRSECMSSQPLYVWPHMHYIWHHIHSLWYHTTLFMTSSPLYLTSHPLYLTSRALYLCNHTHCSNITAILGMISHTVYMWHPIHYIYDIISTMYYNTTLCVVDTTLGICVTSFALLMISHPLYHSKPRFFDVPSTLCMISHPLYQTPHPLYLCHHNLTLSSHTHFSMISYPLYVWHHMHSI